MFKGCVTVCKFILRYLQNIFYGLKARFLALIRLELGLWGFIKSVLYLPFESWNFTILDYKGGFL